MTTDGGFVAWTIRIMETLGAPGAGIAIAAENLFPPIPSEVLLPLAGFTASRGKLGLVDVLLWTTLGSVVGAVALYAVGALLGRERTRALAARLPLFEAADIEKAEAWFDRYGPIAVFVGRMIPIVRSLISVPAGVARMSVPTFLALTAMGSALWNTLFVLAGYQLGEQWWIVEEYAGYVQKAVIAAVVVGVVAFVVVRLRSRRRNRSASAHVCRVDSGTRRSRARR